MDPLAALRDIHLPAEPGWWPPAPGWWLLGVLLLVVLAAACVPAHRWLARQRRRRMIRTKLDALRRQAVHEGDAGSALAELSTLLRRVALVRHPREHVAGLQGNDWLAFLDGTGGNGNFSGEAGRVLAQAPYAAPHATAPADFELVYGAVRGWLERNT